MLRPSSAVFLYALALLLPAPEVVGKQQFELETQSLLQLEQQLAEINAELENLAVYSFHKGVGSIGYQSNSHRQPGHKEWVRVELDREVPIDQIILVPTLRQDTKEGVQSGGFPVCFRILAGTGQTTNVVAELTEKDGLLPRIAPLTVSCASINASWVGVEATKLSRRSSEAKFALQFSELMIFSGLENVALKQPVSTSSSKQKYKSRQTRYLVDGFVPYLMDAAHGTQSGNVNVSFEVNTPIEDASLTIDLQKPFPINEIDLYEVASYQAIPKEEISAAIPPHLRVTGANRPDFADKTLLFEFRQESVYDIGPIMRHRFPEKTCRYVRFEILEFRQYELPRGIGFTAGFSEIEVLSKGKNVALGKPVRGTNLPKKGHELTPLTDGNNHSGEILPLRVWMNQLARRHDLEKERLLVLAELNRRYARQKRNLHITSWLAAFLGAGTVIVVLLDRNMRQRAVFKIRERIAANLHDELGANLHTVGLYTDLAKEAARGNAEDEKWSRVIHYVDKIRTLTERAAESTRVCTNMLEAKELYENPAEQLKSTAGQVLTDLEHDISFTGEEKLKALPPRRRIDLILFYKECLTNIIRHSEATRVKTRLTVDKNKILLTVQDNGKGVSATPPSLNRRARMLKAILSVDSSAEGGTRTELRLKLPGNMIRRAAK